jgi:general secretion pathway protein K
MNRSFDRSATRRATRQRGAALLTAMIVVVLITTMTATMVWQQWRAVQVEAAERARSQSAWMLSGALDWARIILREDTVVGLNSGQPMDHLGEPWAVPLAEARLSTFLAADRNNTDDGPEAFLSGAIEDAQARYNLRNLVQEQAPPAGAPGSAGTPPGGSPAAGVEVVVPVELQTLKRLCQSAGVSSAVADQIAQGLRDALARSAATASSSSNPAIAPRTAAQLTWLGVDREAVERLERYVVLLPKRTTVNLNTASREVLAALVEGLDLGGAERLVQVRGQAPFKTIDDAQRQLGEALKLDNRRVGVASSFFVVSGRMRLDDRMLEERSLVERQGTNMVALSRERFASRESAGAGRP